MNLSSLELALAAVLVLACAVTSMVWRLGLTRSLVISALRTVVQLLLVGEALRFVFALDSAWATASLVSAMLLVAAWEVASRQKQKKQWAFAVGGASVGVATCVVAFIGLRITLVDAGWTQPRYVIPLTGIVLGTALNSATLALNHLLETVKREAKTIETRLALGASRAEAFEQVVRGAMRAGVLPVLNQMAAAGVVTLPGTMTGQILAGAEPQSATRAQVLLMFLLCAGGFFAAFGVVQLGVRRLVDARDRLRM